MKLIFLWGPPAAGKLTIARELARLTGLPLFHNHLVVDALLEKLPFGHPDFIRLRESMWMAGFETAAQSGRSMIFTFQPEPTVKAGFPGRVVDLLATSGDEVKFVRLVISREEQEKRLTNESRNAFRKLVSLDLLNELRDGFEQSEAEMPAADLVIDSAIDEPETAARRIAAAFSVAIAPTAT